MAGDGAPERPCRVCDAARELFTAAIAMASPSNKREAEAQGAAAAAAVKGSDNGGNGDQPQPAARRADCLGCRITGAVTGVGGAAFIASRLLEEPPPRGAHRGVLLASSAVLAGLGLARGFGWY